MTDPDQSRDPAIAARGADSDDMLLGRAVDGDLGALEQLVGRYAPMSHAVALPILGDPGSVASALHASTRARAIELKRGAIPFGAGASRMPVPYSLPASDVGRPAGREGVVAAVEALEPYECTVLDLAYFRGLSSIEIADMLQPAPAEGHRRVSAALAALASAIGSMPDGVHGRGGR